MYILYAVSMLYGRIRKSYDMKKNRDMEDLVLNTVRIPDENQEIKKIECEKPQDIEYQPHTWYIVKQKEKNTFKDIKYEHTYFIRTFAS